MQHLDDLAKQVNEAREKRRRIDVPTEALAETSSDAIVDMDMDLVSSHSLITVGCS